MATIDFVRMMQTSRNTTSSKQTSSSSESTTAFSSLMKQSSQKTSASSADSKKSELKTDADAHKSNAEAANQTEKSEKTEKFEKTDKSNTQQKTEEKKEMAELASMLQAEMQNMIGQLMQMEEPETGLTEGEGQPTVELNLDLSGAAEHQVRESAAEIFSQVTEPQVQVSDGAAEHPAETLESLISQEVTSEAEVSEDIAMPEQTVVSDEQSRKTEETQAQVPIQTEAKEQPESEGTAHLQKNSNQQEHDADSSKDTEHGFETITVEHQAISQYSSLNELTMGPSVMEETTTVVRTTPETFGADIGASLANKLPSADGTLTIELEPATLGKLTLKVMYEGDKATVSILTSNPKTLELLSQSAEEIAQILKERTGQETMIYTPQTEQQQDWTQGGNQDNPQKQRQEDNQQKQQNHAESFAQQLRLGLV